jgi:hypothetical protein
LVGGGGGGRGAGGRKQISGVNEEDANSHPPMNTCILYILAEVYTSSTLTSP